MDGGKPLSGQSGSPRQHVDGRQREQGDSLCQSVRSGGGTMLCEGRQERLEGGTLLSLALWGQLDF